MLEVQTEQDFNLQGYDITRLLVQVQVNIQALLMPRLVVFYFSASWCQPCHLMAPKYAELANSPVPGLNTGSSEVQFNLLEQKLKYRDWHHHFDFDIQ